MGNRSAGDIRQFLEAWGQGDRSVEDQLWHLVYDELRALARQIRRGRWAPEGTTTLVHEAYLRLFGDGDLSPSDRHHFFALAARVMRFVIVDRARERQAAKRAHEVDGAAPEELLAEATQPPEQVLAIHDALELLETRRPRQKQIVEMHYFAGLTFDEIAELLEVSRSTVMRDWRSARIWLHSELGTDP